MIKCCNCPAVEVWFIQYLIYTESNGMYRLFYDWSWCKYPLQSQVLSMSSNPTAVRAEHPILLIHLIHSTLQPAPRSLLRLHGVIFMHHQDVGADECQQYTQGHSRSRRAPLLQEITIMCCSTRFNSALTRSTSLDLVLMRVPKRRFIAWFYTILYIFF